MFYENEKIPYRTFDEIRNSGSNQLWALMHLFDVLVTPDPLEDEFWVREDFDLNSQYISNKNIRDAFEIYLHNGNYIAVNNYQGYRIEITPVLSETTSKCYLRATHERDPEEWRKEGWEVFEDEGGYYIRTLAYAKKRWCYDIAVFDDKEPMSIKHTLLKRKKIMDYLYELKDELKEREANL